MAVCFAGCRLFLPGFSQPFCGPFLASEQRPKSAEKVSFMTKTKTNHPHPPEKLEGIFPKGKMTLQNRLQRKTSFRADVGCMWRIWLFCFFFIAVVLTGPRTLLVRVVMVPVPCACLFLWSFLFHGTEDSCHFLFQNFCAHNNVNALNATTLKNG